MPDDRPPARDPATWNPSAAIAAWVLPGLGHALLGEGKRGVIIGVTILALWLSGLMIGGIGVIDRQRHQWWFLGQMLVAPSLGVTYVRSTFMVEAPSPQEYRAAGTSRIAYQPSFGHPNEQGVLYTALAGLLNLLAIIDVLYRDPRPRGRPAAAGAPDAEGSTP